MPPTQQPDKNSKWEMPDYYFDETISLEHREQYIDDSLLGEEEITELERFIMAVGGEELFQYSMEYRMWHI